MVVPSKGNYKLIFKKVTRLFCLNHIVRNDQWNDVDLDRCLTVYVIVISNLMTGIGRCLVFVLSLIILPLELYGYNKEYIKCSKMKKADKHVCVVLS